MSTILIANELAKKSNIVEAILETGLYRNKQVIREGWMENKKNLSINKTVKLFQGKEKPFTEELLGHAVLRMFLSEIQKNDLIAVEILLIIGVIPNNFTDEWTVSKEARNLLSKYKP